MGWKYREIQIEDDKSIGDSGTETVDIKVTEPITELDIRFTATNDTSILRNQPPEIQVSKIEIVDGGQVYWSLPGPEAVAAAVYEKGVWPDHDYVERASSSQRMVFPLMFGRYLGDPDYALVPARLRNPQLKFTWADQAGYLDDSLTLGVTARVMEDAPPPDKCLLWKEIQSFTSAASGVESVELPTDYPYRRLLVRAYLASTLMSSIITNFKLDCDVGKFIPFDLPTSEFQNIVKSLFGPYQYHRYDVASSTVTQEAWMGGAVAAWPASERWNVSYQCWASGCSWYWLRAEHHESGANVEANTQVLVMGDFPHNSWCYQFGRKDAPETWFNAPEYGEVKLKLTQGTADTEVSAAVQQPRSLP